jgi:arsenite methyltransferase
VTDCWAEWIRTRRSGGDPEAYRRLLAYVGALRDRVLDNAELEDGETVLDVGCGDGLIAFGALERGAGQVVFADISKPLLDDCRELATEAGVLERCRFVEAPAEKLAPIEDESVDVVTTRSVLIYVKDKASAFAEFLRVLRPGGRMSLYEPINRFGMEQRARTWGYTLGDESTALMAKLSQLEARYQGTDDPILDFDERDLLALAEGVGFFPIELDYVVEIRPLEPRGWESALHTSGNPKIPTLHEAMEQALTPAERERLVAELRPAVEAGRGVWRMGHAYLSGVKPG